MLNLQEQDKKRAMNLSIIIPVYNTENYLERCLVSCLEQDIPETGYEIIVVNDGSTDGSLSIAEAVAAAHPNIRVISMENGGASRARNTGLAAAQGEYVWFVDSDDYITRNCLGGLLDKCTRDDLDVVGIGMFRGMPDGSVSERRYYRNEHSRTVYDGPSAMRAGLFKTVCPPLYIIRRSFLLENGLSFPDGFLHEDEEFTPRMFYLARRISFVEECFYFACVRPGSSMQTPNPKRAFDLLTIARRLDAFSSERVSRRDRHLFSLQIARVTDSCLKLCQCLPEETVAAVNDLLLSGNRWFAGHLIRSRDPKFMLAGFLFRLLPKRPVSVYGALLKLVRPARK